MKKKCLGKLFHQNQSCLYLICFITLIQFKMNKNSGAKLEIKKGNKQNKESKVEQPPLKPIIEQKSKQKDKNDKKVKNDKADKTEVADDKDKTSKKKDKKVKQQQKAEDKLSKSKEKKQKKDKQDKNDKKDKKQKKDKKDKKDKKNKKDKGDDQQSSSKLQNLKKSSSIKKGDKEFETINNIHKSQNKAKMSIQQLIEQYKSQAQRLLFQNHGYDPQKQIHIQKQLEALQKQRQKRHKKIEQLKMKRQQIEKSQQKSKEVKMQLRKQKLRERKIKKAEQKLSKIEISAQERRRDYQNFIQYVKQRKKFKPRFKKYQQQYQQYLRQQEQNYRDKLDELSRKYDPMNPIQLSSFEQNYLTQKQESIHYRQNKLKLEQDLIKQQNDRREKLLWKGQCHKNVTQEETERLHKKKKPWQKLQAIKQYGKFIAENIRKQKQEPAQNQTENDQQQYQKNSRVAYHQKYVKGVNYGLVPYQKPAPLSLEEKFKKGNQYLQQIKQYNKSRKNKTVDYTNINSSRKLSASEDLKNNKQTFKLRRKSNPYYPTEQNKNQIDFKNYESIEFSIQKLNKLKKDRQLNDQIVKHGQYGSILDIQERKRRGGSLVVKQINQKLNLLKKL